MERAAYASAEAKADHGSLAEVVSRATVHVPSSAISLDDLQQDVDIDRLGDGRNGAERLRSLFDVDSARHDGDRNIGNGGIAKLRPTELVAAQAGHLQIEQDQAWRLGRAMSNRTEQVERLQTIFGADRVETLHRQQRRQHVPYVRIVFHDQNVPQHIVGACSAHLVAPINQTACPDGPWLVAQ
jgi:hypothetical protein